MKRVCLFLLLGLVSGPVFAQQEEFCDAVGAIVRDAPNKFKNIKGKLRESGPNAVIWNCGIKVPGTIQSRFVSSMGLFYEGAFFQTKNKDLVKGVYDKYKAVLTGCLSPQGYKLTSQDNFYPGLGNYKKLVYMQDLKEGDMPAQPPAHITMEAAYSKEMGVYTVTMYIFEH